MEKDNNEKPLENDNTEETSKNDSIETTLEEAFDLVLKMIKMDVHGCVYVDIGNYSMQFSGKEKKKHSADKKPARNDNKCGAIYLLQEREFLNSGENVYKIGRTSQEGLKRFDSYPKGSVLYCIRKSDNPIRDEKTIKNVFDDMFENRDDIGREYYQGDLTDMISIFYRHFGHEEDTGVEYYAKGTSSVICDNYDDNYDADDELIAEFIAHIKRDRPDWYKPGQFVPKMLIVEKYNDRHDGNEDTRSFWRRITKLGLKNTFMSKEKICRIPLNVGGSKTYMCFKCLEFNDIIA